VRVDAGQSLTRVSWPGCRDRVGFAGEEDRGAFLAKDIQAELAPLKIPPKKRTGLRSARAQSEFAAANRLLVSVSQRELMAGDAEDLAVRQVVRPASRDSRPVMCVPAAVPSERVGAATSVMRRRRAGVLASALAPAARPAVSLILDGLRESHNLPPPMAAPGPRADFEIELRYADHGNGSAVFLRGDRDGLQETVPVAPTC